MNAFILKIRKYRLLRNLTQKELAVLSGVSQQYISELEKGVVRTKSPTLDTIKDLARALNVCPYALITPDDCRLDYGKCVKKFKMDVHQDIKNFMEQIANMSKKNNMLISDLLDKALEILKKEYSE